MNQIMNRLIADINKILKNNNIHQSITINDLSITDKTITDLVKPDSVLSNSIINSIWPSIDRKFVYHYTSQKSAEDILNSNSFRLYSILNRFDEGEIITFCENHGLQGYLDIDENGEKIYKSLIMPNMFYSSFTDTTVSKKQEEYFWNVFAKGCGVRLKFEIKAKNPDFRKIVYESSRSKPIEVLSELTNTIRTSYNREFILKGISRLCAFYLAESLEIENEFRMLYRVWDEDGPQPSSDGAYKYIELPLNKMSKIGFQLNITEIQSDQTLSIPPKYSVVKRSA